MIKDKGGPKNAAGLLPCAHCGQYPDIINHPKFGKIVRCICGLTIGTSMRDEWTDLTPEIKWNTRGGVRF